MIRITAPTVPIQPSIRPTFRRPRILAVVYPQYKCKATDFLGTSDSLGGVDIAEVGVVIFKRIIDTVIINNVRTRNLDTALRRILCNTKIIILGTLIPFSSTFVMFLCILHPAI